MLLVNVAAFAGAALLFAMIPGPSTAVLLRQTLRSGRRAALATTLANEIGLLFWSVVSALGLSVLVAASQAAYDVIKVLGAIVLAVLGVQSLLHSRRYGSRSAHEAVATSETISPSEANTGHAFRVGLLTILANPKAAVFAASFLPQFVPAHAPVLATMLLLSVVWVVVDTGWYILLAWMINRARLVFSRPRVRRRLEQISGVVLIGFGVRLAIEHR